MQNANSRRSRDAVCTRVCSRSNLHAGTIQVLQMTARDPTIVTRHRDEPETNSTARPRVHSRGKPCDQGVHLVPRYVDSRALPIRLLPNEWPLIFCRRKPEDCRRRTTSDSHIR
jgi:hypothetical protein